MVQLLCIIGIFKHISVASIGETCFDKINFNYIFEAFHKPKCSTFLAFKFNVPCGSHVMAYFNK